MVKIAVNNVAITAMKPGFVTDLLVDVTMDVNQGGKALRAMNVSVVWLSYYARLIKYRYINTCTLNILY